MDVKTVRDILHLMGFSPMHKSYPLAAFNMNILASLECGNFRLYYDHHRIIGFVNWTFISQSEITEVAESGGVIQGYMWRSAAHPPGKDLYIPELIAPFGQFRDIYRDLQRFFIDCPTAFGLRWKGGHNSIPRTRRIANLLIES